MATPWRSLRLCMSRSIRARAAASSVGGAATRIFAAAAAAACAPIAAAHGFGQRYDLPLPLSLYLFGAAAAVAFSFVVVGLFARRRESVAGDYGHINLLAYPPARLVARPGFVFALRFIALCLLMVTIVAGFWGNQNPYRNIAPTLVWVIWWVGLAYVCAFAGNLWALVNPWRTGFDWVTAAYWRITARTMEPRLSYPERLGVWPAFFLLLAFSWTELVYPDAAAPAHIAWLAVFYSILTWAGMFAFGGDIWLRHGEVFTLVFSTFARLAPTEVRVLDPAVCERCEAHCRNPDGACIDCYDCFRRADAQQRVWALRPFGAGLLDSRPVSASMMAFVLLLLSSVLYDGALGTPEWRQLEKLLAAFAPGLGDWAPIAIRTLGLVGFWLVFFGAYVAVGAIMNRVAAAERRSPWDLAQTFALTLVPIAIAYHLAHYLSFLLRQGQYILPLLSDPFGYGWNLFGTAGYRVDIAIVGAAFAWYAAVAAVVSGHIAAVYLAHRKAMRVLGTRGAALCSQIPLTALMVVYTFFGLSILAEPITEHRAAAQPTIAGAAISVPQDALLPVPGDGRLQPVGAGRQARLKLTYRVLGSAFHDGMRTNAADLLYPYMFAYRWGVRTQPATAHYDPYVDAATAPLREHLAAVRVVGVDTTSKSFQVGEVNFLREIFEVEVYTTTTPEDAEQDAAFAPPWSTLPWHLIVLMEEAVSRGWAAFSSDEARRRGVEWLDLVRSDSTNRRLAALVETFEREAYRPEALRSLVSSGEARKRWAALGAFYKAHGHFLVTNGPYQLKGWSAGRVELEVFRDLSYPLGVGSYDVYAVPRRGFVTKVERLNGRISLSGEVETIMKFQRSYELVRAPIPSLAADDLKRAALECRYTIVDSQKRVVQAGVAHLSGDGKFQVNLDRKLPAAGRYTMFAQITVNGNAMNGDIRQIPISGS